MTHHARVVAWRGGLAEVELDLEVPAELVHFRGHFPGIPLLAGVVQIDWAIKLAREHFSLGRRFTRLSMLKFSRVIRPGAAVRLSLRCDESGSELMFRFCDDAGDYSSGRVSFTNED